jgi:hypothetical protein
MGEAKKRGSVNERAAQALGDLSIMKDTAALRSRDGFPSDAEFVAYVIHVPESDDFLSIVAETASMSQRAFVRTPGQAMRVTDLQRAIRLADTCTKRAIVGALFETSDGFYVSFAEQV